MENGKFCVSRTEGAEDAESVLLVGAVDSCLPHFQLHFLIPTLYFLLRYLAQRARRFTPTTPVLLCFSRTAHTEVVKE